MQSPRAQVLLFDVNETLLDLAPVRQRINDLLLDEDGATLWFSTLLHHSLVMTVSGRYTEFTDIGGATLQMLARSRDIAMTDDDAKQALSGMRRLAPHPDVAPSLERLKRAGYRLAALTNSSTSGLKAQLEHARLAGYFERQLSVEAQQLFKPHATVYAWAATEMGVGPSACVLVAAHGWDVAGAKWAGMRTAFIGRSGQQKFPLAPTPDIEVPDLSALADALDA